MSKPQNMPGFSLDNLKLVLTKSIHITFGALPVSAGTDRALFSVCCLCVLSVVSAFISLVLRPCIFFFLHLLSVWICAGLAFPSLPGLKSQFSISEACCGSTSRSAWVGPLCLLLICNWNDSSGLCCVAYKEFLQISLFSFLDQLNCS